MPEVVYIELCEYTGRMTKAQYKHRIEQIDLLIDSLLEVAFKSVANGNMIEYEIDTGQTKNRVIYSNTSSVTNAIKSYQMLRDMYQSRVSPSMVRLIPATSMPKRC